MSSVINCQYSFFETKEETENRALIDHIKELEASIGRIRRGQFAKLGEHNKRILELENKMDIIERNICRGT